MKVSRWVAACAALMLLVLAWPAHAGPRPDFRPDPMRQVDPGTPLMAYRVGDASSFAPSLLATEEPVFSSTRFSLGVGLNYAWHSGEVTNLPTFEKEWEVGAYGAYVLTPHVSLAGSSVYGVDNQSFRSSLGLRFRIWRGGE